MSIKAFARWQMGIARWKWLASQRRNGRLIDPSVELRFAEPLDARLSLGPAATLDKGVIVWISDECGEKARISVGARSYVGPYTFIGSCHTLEIGEDTLIGASCYLITVNHRKEDPNRSTLEQGYRGADVRIGRNVWIGTNVVVLPGVCIGDGAVIGAGAVVTKNVPPGETWCGVPARRMALGGERESK
jgi:acetyltransferase-like isoleucine patch superfamily enzyme